MAKLKNQREWKPLPHHFETPEGISETVPNEAMTVREILQRFSRNLSVDGQKEGLYNPNPSFDDVDFNEFAGADLHEQQIISDQIKADRKTLDNKIKETNESIRKAKKAKDDEEKEFREEIRKRKQNEQGALEADKAKPGNKA